jgi:hypothetical protein
MSLVAIKKEIDAMSEIERSELLQYLRGKWFRDDPEWQAELSRRLDEVRAGKFYTKEDLERIHAQRVAEEG